MYNSLSLSLFFSLKRQRDRRTWRIFPICGDIEFTAISKVLEKLRENTSGLPNDWLNRIALLHAEDCIFFFFCLLFCHLTFFFLQIFRIWGDEISHVYREQTKRIEWPFLQPLSFERSFVSDAIPRLRWRKSLGSNFVYKNEFVSYTSFYTRAKTYCVQWCNIRERAAHTHPK